MPLILPNDIANDQDADGDLLQQNFATIEDWGNQEAITRDGSTAMVNQLLLPGSPTEPNQAATKAYVDAQTGTAASAITALTARVTALEALNTGPRLGQLETDNTNQANAIATHTNQVAHLYSRTDWLRARTQGLVIGAYVGVTTNENGDFTCNFPGGLFPAGTPTAVTANIADGNVGAFILITFTNHVGFTGRVVSHNGSFAAHLTVAIEYIAFDANNGGYP